MAAGKNTHRFISIIVQQRGNRSSQSIGSRAGVAYTRPAEPIDHSVGVDLAGRFLGVYVEIILHRPH